MTAGLVTPAVLKWAERARPHARVTGCTIRPLDGGAVSRLVDQVTLHLTGGDAPLDLALHQPQPELRPIQPGTYALTGVRRGSG
jgi:hypothetical protein